MGKKGSWLKIAYDDAGREGWLEHGARAGSTSPGRSSCPAALVRLLPGLKKGFYACAASSRMKRPPK